MQLMMIYRWDHPSNMGYHSENPRWFSLAVEDCSLKAQSTNKCGTGVRNNASMVCAPMNA